MSEQWEQMLGIADATMVPMDMKHMGLKQQKRVAFQVKDTPLTYGMDLLHGYYSADYETAALVFHVRKHAYLLVEKSGATLSFDLLNLEGYDQTNLKPKSKTPRGVLSAAKQFKARPLGTTTSAPEAISIDLS